MATIDDRKVIDDLMANNGHFMDDPQVQRIVEYTNALGRRTWGIVYPGEDLYRYQRQTEYVQDPVVIWTVENEFYGIPLKGKGVFRG